MGIFSKTPEEIAAREASKRRRDKELEEENQRLEKVSQENAFNNTHAGKARSARNAGARTFQISLQLSETQNVAIPVIGGTYKSKATIDHHATIIDSVEAEGWRLEHAGYVYQVSGSVTSKSLLANGLQEAVHGEIIGIYIFRFTEVQESVLKQE